jgi:hypothetical protein
MSVFHVGPSKLVLKGDSEMRANERIFLGFSMVVILVSGCRAQDKPVLSRSPFSEEQLGVYRGLLDMLSGLHYKNLSTVSVPFDFTGFPETRPCLNGIELENISEAMRITHTFGPEITKGPDLKLVDRQEQIGLLKQRDASPNVQKEKLTPGSQQTGSDLNFLVLSEIAFDKKHQFAVVKYLFRCGEHCGGGSTLVMENVKGKWTPSSRVRCATLIGY